jgi:integrase
MRGVVVLFLQARPLRLANLCGLRLGQHLQRDDPRGGRITRIWIPAEETKNNREINLPVPRPLADQLEDWLRVFRPLIAAPDCVYLFPGHGTGNRPVTPQAMREAVKGVTRQYVGVELSPHQFRHLSACVFLDENPGQYEPVRQLLNHASVETAARSYAGIEHAATARRYDEVILYRRHRRKRPKAAGASKRRTREAKD